MRVDTETGLVFHRGLMVKSTITIRLIQALAAVFGVIYLLLLVRFTLTYIGANQSAGFSQFIWTATATLYSPFRWLLHRGDDGAGHPIEWSLLVAVAAYGIVHALLRRLVLALGRA
jgi:hypothetical protein